MTDAIKSVIEKAGLLICPFCEGEGEVGYFCGHETTTECRMCGGNGIIRSTKKQKHSKKRNICNGNKGGCGGCNFHPKGLIVWTSYELFIDSN